MSDPYEHYPQNRPMPHPGTGDGNDLRPQYGDGIEFAPPTDDELRALTFADTHAVNQREHDMLLYWYGIHCKDRMDFKTAPLPYDEWYPIVGQVLLLDYYREIVSKGRGDDHTTAHAPAAD